MKTVRSISLPNCWVSRSLTPDTWSKLREIFCHPPPSPTRARSGRPPPLRSEPRHFASGLIRSGLRRRRYPPKRSVGRTSTSDAMPRYLLDTNVLLRAAQEEAADHTVAISAISSLAARGEDLVFTPKALIDFWSVL